MLRRSLLRQPTYRLHKPSGKAVVTLNGKDFYLGVYGAPESRTAYDELMARWLASGRRLPEIEVDHLSINELILRYYRHSEARFEKRRTALKRLSQIRCALRPVKQLFGSTPAADFGPRSLLTVRKQFIEVGLARKTVNDNIQLIKRLFKWAVREEFVPPSVHHGLSSIDGLRAGESHAPEPVKVQPVPDSHVDATLPFVLRPVRAMIELQRLTGMRSNETTAMRTGDIDMSGKIWVYRPRHHKNDHRGHEREIMLGPSAQEIVRAFIRANLQEHIFRPDEAERERDSERRVNRKTPLYASETTRRRRRRTRNPKRAPTDHYSTDTYAQAIRRACDRADAEAKREHAVAFDAERIIPRWSPHRLRHSFATNIRRQHGVEAARLMLGHQHVSVTEVYAERDATVAATIALKHG